MLLRSSYTWDEYISFECNHLSVRYSDIDGVWYSTTPVMTASDVGDYDILVDIGNNGVHISLC